MSAVPSACCLCPEYCARPPKDSSLSFEPAAVRVATGRTAWTAHYICALFAHGVKTTKQVRGFDSVQTSISLSRFLRRPLAEASPSLFAVWMPVRWLRPRPRAPRNRASSVGKSLPAYNVRPAVAARDTTSLAGRVAERSSHLTSPDSLSARDTRKISQEKVRRYKSA